jgi:hypothetical protein
MHLNYRGISTFTELEISSLLSISILWCSEKWSGYGFISWNKLPVLSCRICRLCFDKIYVQTYFPHKTGITLPQGWFIKFLGVPCITLQNVIWQKEVLVFMLILWSAMQDWDILHVSFTLLCRLNLPSDTNNTRLCLVTSRTTFD